MKKTDGWMPLYVADYLADTARLTTEQHGAYLLLIMDYWRNGAPEHDDETLASITRLSVQQWRKHAPKILCMFQPTDGLLIHKRVEAERQKAGAISINRSAAGKHGAAKRWGKEMANGMANGMAKTSQSGSQNDAPSPTPTTKEKKQPPKPPAADAAGFAEFWSAWPRKVGKAQAEKAWTKLHPSDDLVAAILRAIAAQSRSPQWLKDGGQFIPHPATWLNGKRWEDETDAKTQAPGLFAGVRVDNMEAA